MAGTVSNRRTSAPGSRFFPPIGCEGRPACAQTPQLADLAGISRCRNASTRGLPHYNTAKLNAVTNLPPNKHSSNASTPPRGRWSSPSPAAAAGLIAACWKCPAVRPLARSSRSLLVQPRCEQWLGGPVDHYCSERTARAMAMAAFERRALQRRTHDHAARHRCDGQPGFNRPKRGPHRIHVAWQSADYDSRRSLRIAERALAHA